MILLINHGSRFTLHAACQQQLSHMHYDHSCLICMLHRSIVLTDKKTARVHPCSRMQAFGPLHLSRISASGMGCFELVTFNSLAKHGPACTCPCFAFDVKHHRSTRQDYHSLRQPGQGTCLAPYQLLPSVLPSPSSADPCKQSTSTYLCVCLSNSILPRSTTPG